MRCSSCEKFVSLELNEEPEENSEPEAQDDGESGATVTAEYRIVRTCGDCGQDMKSATFNLEGEVELGMGEGDDTTPGHAPDCDPDSRELEVEVDSVEATEEGGGRYKKAFYGVVLEATVTCSCCGAHGSLTLSDKCAASAMDEEG